MKIRKWSDVIRRRYSDERIVQFRADAAAEIGRMRLEDLLAKVTPDNIHGETDMGEPFGNEYW